MHDNVPACGPASLIPSTTPLTTAQVDPLAMLGSTASNGGGLDDMLGGFAAPGAPSSPGAAATITAFDKDGVAIAFRLSKAPGQPAGETEVVATYTNSSASRVTDFMLQAAVPKFMTLQLEPASSTELAPHGGSATQRIHVVNSQHGVKPLAMRLRVAYSRDGAAVVEQCQVSNFPAGF